MQIDCQVRGMSKDDAMMRGRWRKMIRMFDEQEGCEWMDVSSGTPAHPGSPRQRAAKTVVCVCVCVAKAQFVSFELFYCNMCTPVNLFFSKYILYQPYSWLSLS